MFKADLHFVFYLHGDILDGSWFLERPRVALDRGVLVWHKVGKRLHDGCLEVEVRWEWQTARSTRSETCTIKMYASIHFR